MDVRPLTVTDLTACAALYCEVYAETPYGESWKPADAQAYLEYFWQMAPPTCFVAASNHDVHGAIFAYACPWQGWKRYCVQELFVSTASRGTGVGKRLLRQLAKDDGVISVWLIANRQAPAAQFYEHMGLSADSTYGYYSGTVYSA